MRVLDSHLHLWDPEVLTYTWLEGAMSHRFAGPEFERVRLSGAETERAVFVQAGTVDDDFLDEVRWVADMAPVLGVVGIVAGIRLDRGTDTVAQLEGLVAEPLVVGVRHNLQGEADGLAMSAAFVTGAREVAARGLTFDACVRADQLPDLARLAGAIPELRIVLDHLGTPAVGAAAGPLPPSPAWVRDLAELARHPNAFCKLSGLPGQTGGDWSAEQVEPFLDVAADTFGVERLMWGSDWPVSAFGPVEPDDPRASREGAAAYQPAARARWADVVIAWAQSRGHDLDAMTWGTAEQFYRTDARPQASSSEAPRRGLRGWLRGDRG